MKGRYSLLIVDDEELIREFIKNCINWQSLGIEIIADVSSAIEGLEIARKEKPSIICADICMPVINGLEFIQKLEEINCKSHVVVISGHDDFSYIQKSLRLRVEDYILKPIDENEIYSTMKKIISLLEKEETQNAIINGFKQDKMLHTEIKQYHHKNSSMMEVEKYTRENFAEPNLSLQILADRFFLNPAYISRAFKQEIGEKWNDFLFKLRMEKAIELLSTTDLLCYEIARDIGITDAKYFSLCFKQYTGKTISEWKSAHFEIEMNNRR